MSTLVTKPARVLKAAAREVAWPADAEGLFRRLSSRSHCAWLDSAGGPPTLARWSVLAAEPSAILAHEDDVTSLRDAGGRVLLETRGRPMEALREALASVAVDADGAAAAIPFGPGFYGYLSYDLAPYIEPTSGLSPCRDIALPDLWFGLYEAVLVLDRLECRAHLVGARGPAWEVLEEALAHELERSGSGRRLAVARDPPRTTRGRPESERGGFPEPPRTSAGQRVTHSMTREEFLRAVARAREYIAAGDIFQVNLSRRLTAPLAGAGGPADLYLRLRRANPAPYAAYLDLGGGRAILSSSPELFLDLRDGAVVTRPIKGTRPHRPGAEALNARMRAELVASEKDRAELVMIVDLERNDLGRVCSYGSVRVAEPRAVEAYASVYHTVATVTGRLHEDRDLVDLLKATFPGGSITGAPKIRSMQIIAELEPTRRSVYTGAVGYLGLASASERAGRCVLNIAIRTLLAAGGSVHLQVGGGIVADSRPEEEYAETEDKARAMLEALRLNGNAKC
jgi:para-aminobenzoate synthetase component 1